MDLEDYRDVLAAYQAVARKSIVQYDGFIARYMGDGLLAYFGYPQAHEEDPERAVRAALSIVKNVKALALHDGRELLVRIGIATGLVVAGDIVGEGASEERAVLGDTPNLAARLQALAEPNQVLIDDATRRMTGNAFEFEYRGPQVLKGFSKASVAWRVTGESGAQSRFEASHPDPLTPLVGREHELDLLLERWKRSQKGEGQIVLLSGGPGIGKSRLVQALLDKVADDPHFRLEHQCSPLHVDSAFHPIIQRLERAAGFAAEDSTEIKLDKLEASLRPNSEHPLTAAPLFAALLSIPGEGRYGSVDLTPEQRRDRTFAALTDQVVALSRHQPVLFVLEDAHWIDPTTQDLIGEIIGRVSNSAVFMLISHRLNYRPPWSIHADATSLTLNRLSRDESVAIVRAAGGQDFNLTLIDRIITRADGVPLFVEELAKSILEADLSSEEIKVDDQIPTTLLASLTARLDRLGDAKEIAQIGAAIGREYDLAVVSAVARRMGSSLGSTHDELVQSGLVFRSTRLQSGVYTFKHALVQEAAYETMLKSKRAQLHRNIAEVLEAEFAPTAETRPEILARHYAEANMPDRAIAFWQRAGELCTQTSANIEAVRHFERALDLLATLPETESRDETELRLRVASGGPLLMTRGHGATEVEIAYSRARELSERAGDKLQLMPALFGLWRYFIGRGDCQVTRELGVQILELSENADDRSGQVLGHYALGYTLFCCGELGESLKHFEAGHRLYDLRLRESVAFRLGQDPGVACLAYGSLAQWVLGYPDAALRMMRDALSLAESLSHPFSMAYALSLACQIYQLYSDADAVLGAADKAITISSEHGFAVWHASPTIFRGWARSRLGDALSGTEEMREGIASIRKAGMEMRRPFYLSLLAEGNVLAGRTTDASAVIGEALTVIEKTGERWSEAELYRFEGDMWADADPARAEAKLQLALRVARQQKAKSWELRATISLARLWRDQGKRKDAADLLRPICAWFTEGFQTNDLINGRALLAELS
jgi:predicted ATPase/class 3 adenylate cyclase